MEASLAVSLEISVVTMFSLLFAILEKQVVHVGIVMGSTALVACGGLALVMFSSSSSFSMTSTSSVQSFRGAATLLVLLYVLTPVLASLARPIADDTIYAASVLLLVSHTLLHDYSEPGDVRDFQTLTSTNAGLLCTLFLTSRLERHDQRFCFIFLGLCTFALLPIVTSHVRRHYYSSVYLRVAVLFPIATMCSLYFYCHIHAPAYTWAWWAFACVIITVNLIVPSIMYKMQSLKHVLKGQWSEVLLQDLELRKKR